MEFLDPYGVLGVSKTASIADIRKAYRELAKKYHPDINSDDGAAAMTARINAAYNLLIDPGKKLAYDKRSSFVYEEDADSFEQEASEEDSREFVEQKISLSWQAARKRVQRQKAVYRMVRMICYPIALFSLMVGLDYFLPVSTELDYPLYGYQKNAHGKYSYVSSYMKTEEYEFEVPNRIHVDYDYNAGEKKLLCMEFTPIFKTLKRIGVDHGEYALMYKAPGTIYFPLLFPVPYILLILSGFFIRKKEYTRIRYSFCFLPVAIALVYAGIMIMW